MSIAISQAKSVMETLNATHVVIFAVSADGSQHVATYGKSKDNAREAAQAGNNLKAKLGWPVDLCNSSPMERICQNCDFYKPDYGIWCFNGWSGDGSSGQCFYLPRPVAKRADDMACSGMEPRG